MAVTNQQIFDFLLANPNISDAELAAVMDAYGVSPQQVAQATGTSEAAAQQRYEAVTQPVTQPVYTPPVETYYEPVYQPDYSQQYTQNTYEVPIVNTSVNTSAVTNTIKDYQGKTYDTTTLLNLAKELAPSIDANRLKGGVYSTTGESIGFNYDEATKALGYAPSAAEQVVLDMARHLMNEGVTSASQIDATDTNRRFGSTFSGEGGTIYEIKRDADGNLVTSTWGKTTSDKGNIIAAATIAAAFMGVPADIGTAVLGQGASNLAVNTIGGAIFGGGTAALSGGDILKGALLGAGGGAAGSYLNTAGGAVLGDASDIAMSMADAGKSLAEIQSSLASSGFSADVIAESLKDAANVMSPTALNAPANVPSLLDTVNVSAVSGSPSLTNLLSAASTVPINTVNNVTTPTTNTINVVGDRPVTNTQDVISAITNNLAATNVTTPTNLDTVEVVSNTPNTLDLNSVINLVNSGNLDTSNLVNNVADTTTTKKDDKLTTGDVIRLVGAGTTLAAMDAAKQGADTGTQFPIIPVPEEWTGQPPTVVAPRPKLQPIDFGSRNLLMGTQWEKFLSPTYGQVPTPVQYSQPTNLSYNDLMSILGSKQGMPSASSLSINDIISGIQNQYGQAPTRTMG